MVEEWRKWKHITKLDPDKKINDKIIEDIIETGTDAIMISGTQNITKDNVSELLKMLNEYDIPKVLEPASTGKKTLSHSLIPDDLYTSSSSI